MAHAFSVEIHVFLSGKILEAEERKQAALRDEDKVGQRYFEGRLMELNLLRRYLSDTLI